MGVTSLKRKARRNRVVAKQRLQGIKLVTVKPVIKKVDIEDVKEEFKNSEKISFEDKSKSKFIKIKDIVK